MPDGDLPDQSGWRMETTQRLLLDEIAAHGSAEVAADLLVAMLALSAKVQDRLQPFLPHLDRRELRARLRFVSCAALGPPPRPRRVARAEGEQPLDHIDYLFAFAKAALR